MTNTTPTPRDLDPKFKDAQLPADAREESKNDDRIVEDTPEKEKELTPQEALENAISGEVPNDPEGGFIVHKTRYTDDNGVQREKVHGPMPVSEWADYQRKNGI